MLIGYASTKLEKVCTKRKETLKALSQESAEVLPRRLEDLEAFNNLGQIPIRQTPLHFHPLREDRSGEYVIKLKGGDGIVFRPTGDFETSEDGAPILASVTKIEVVLVGNYHSND
ncbi:hypothetical protein LBMAG52_45180 [Planctomycetia bacterium]|nr:hypothetical protein LBMAG52_45180 [Planctomycetia bacterium]